MNILDEDIGLSQRRSLESWKVHFRQVGVEIGRSGLKDRNEVIPLLHQLKHPRLGSLGIMAFIVQVSDIMNTAWSISMSGMTKLPNIFAGSCAIQLFAIR